MSITRIPAEAAPHRPQAPPTCWRKRVHRLALLLAMAAGLAGQAAAQTAEKFTFLTNWYAQAEHGGFYQAVATGIYKDLGLDVTVRMGGPQVNIFQLMAAGQADCILAASDLAVMVARAGGLPVKTVAAVFQKDPQVLIAHEDVKSFEEMKGKTILVTPTGQRTFWLWLKAKYGLSDAQVRPYTFNIQPFVADASFVQQGYLTSEPFALARAGVKIRTFLFADHGWTSYGSAVACMDETLNARQAAVSRFVRGTMLGWKSYLADPAPGNALIRKDNPNMTEEQLAYSLAKFKEAGLIAGMDAARDGIGSMSEERIAANYRFLVDQKLVNAAVLGPMSAYNLSFINGLKVLP